MVRLDLGALCTCPPGGRVKETITMFFHMTTVGDYRGGAGCQVGNLGGNFCLQFCRVAPSRARQPAAVRALPHGVAGQRVDAVPKGQHPPGENTL